MKITHPVYFLAIAAALISSLTTQAYGQTAESVLACEQFNTAIAERGNATVVSGIELEETSFVEFFNFGAPFFEQVVDATTAQLTLPSGTLTKVSSTGTGLFEEGERVGSEFGADQNYISIFGPGLPGPIETVALTPVSGMGTAIGVCFVGDFQDFDTDENVDVAGGEQSRNFFARIFNGDNLIGEVDRLSPSFIAPPGQVITRVEFLALRVFDIQAAFGPNPAIESSQQDLIQITSEIADLVAATSDPVDSFFLDRAENALTFATDDAFYEEGGDRLSQFGANMFVGAAYSVLFLQRADVDGAEELVDRILETLDKIVDDEIAYAIENGGRPEFIDRAEDVVAIAEFIDDDLGNEFVATIAYRLAWINAYLATY